MDTITIKGARQHNLKSIDAAIPKNKLVVFTGLSGSGKSSLAFDTIYAEGQRRYVESLSAYARQFLGVMQKPDVDTIEGLSPAISIDQKTASHNPRSTVGTVTEIYDYIRLLFARVGHPHCPNCSREVAKQSPQQIIEQIMQHLEQQGAQTGGKQLRYMILSPVVRDRKGEFAGLFKNLSAKGYTNVRVDGAMMGIADDFVLIKTNKHTIEVVIDKFSISKKGIKDTVARANLLNRVREAVQQGLELSDGLVILSQVRDAALAFPDKPQDMQDHLYSQAFACPVCNISMPEIEPRSFSFNSPHGACAECGGIGTVLMVDPELVLNKNLSIDEGGILPFARMFVNDTWYARLIAVVAAKHDISTKQRIASLSDIQRRVLLYGTGDTIHEVVGTNRLGETTSIHEPFTGIIAELKRRFSESDSDYARAEIEKYMRAETCTSCRGARLKPESLGVTVNGHSIVEVTRFTIAACKQWFAVLPEKLSPREQQIAKLILREINSRLNFLDAVGLSYLTLDRSAATLSGGEAQRIRLTSQIGSGLSGVIYVLDEPSIGLHQRDNARLIRTLKRLRDLGNTILVVEHDREIMESADCIFDFGPAAGKYGGTIVAHGTPPEIIQNKQSLTGKFLSNKKQITADATTQKSITPRNQSLVLSGCRQHNLKSITAKFPLGLLTCVTGVSGSGKSTLVVETLYRALALHLNRSVREKPGAFENMSGIDEVDKVVLIDQSPIGRTPRSNPATYTSAFTHIRELFAQLPDAKAQGFNPGRFSFNVTGGRCEMCSGEGQIKIEMQFLADVYVTCEVCHGARYNNATLEITYKGRSIADVLQMTVDDAVELFRNVPSLHHKLAVLAEVGLGYMELGQPAPTLSGGEAQRVKLAAELARKQTGNTVYILDEPTTGLHFADLQKLLNVLYQLVSRGNTVIVIEHNLDMIKNAEHIIDLGPEGGDRGGKIVASGPPTEIVRHPASYTGQFLQKVL